MSSIVVFRGVGDRKGQDIIDAILSSTTAKLERGRVEMDEHDKPAQTVSMEVVYRPGLRRGQLVEVNDSTQGGSWRGKIVEVTHRIGLASHSTLLRISRPLENF